MMNKFVLASVIIPVYNDPERLKLCLNSLTVQEADFSYEILVVDNGSQADIKAVTDQYDDVIYLVETKPGSYAARNVGIKYASGEFLAFTDSDCIPAPDWLSSGVEILQNEKQCDIVGGDIRVFTKAGKGNLFERYDTQFGFRQKKAIEDWGYTVTANLITRKTVFEKHGLFNSELKSGGDVEWCKRITGEGGKLCYSKNIIINHPALSTFKKFYSKYSRVAGGKVNDKNFTLNRLLKYSKRYFFSIFSVLGKVEDELTISESYGLVIVHSLKVHIYIFEMFRVYLGGSVRR